MIEEIEGRFIRLLDQQKKASAVGEISIHGDFVSGNKTVIDLNKLLLETSHAVRVEW